MLRCVGLCILVQGGVGVTQEPHQLPRLELDRVAATTVGYFHIVRIPSDGATLVHTLRAFVEPNRIAMEFSDTQPRVDRSTWPSDAWASVLQLDSEELVYHSGAFAKARRFRFPGPGQSRPTELSTTSGYSLPQSMYAVRDSWINRRVHRAGEGKESALADTKLSVSLSGGRAVSLTEERRQAGSSKRRTTYRYDDSGKLVKLTTTLEPYWLEMRGQGEGRLKLPWFSPPRKVVIAIGAVGAGDVAIPRQVSVSKPWSDRVRLPLRESRVFSFETHNDNEARVARSRFSDNGRIYGKRMAYYQALRQISGHRDRVSIARDIEEKLGEAASDGQRLSDSLDRLGFWRSTGDVAKAGEKFSAYLSMVQELLPDGLAIPLGLDLLQNFSRGAMYDEFRSRLIDHVRENISTDAVIGELMLVKRNCFFPATCLRMLESCWRADREVTHAMAVDIAYLESSLAVLCLHVRDGRNSAWECVREELRHLENEVFKVGFEKYCGGIERRAEEAWRRLSDDDRGLRGELRTDIEESLRSAMDQWEKTESRNSAP